MSSSTACSAGMSLSASAPRSMRNMSRTVVDDAVRHGTSRSTLYFGGGTTIWVIELIAMIGRLYRESTRASEPPPLERHRLCTRRGRHSPGVRSLASPARSVWWLSVRGLGRTAPGHRFDDRHVVGQESAALLAQ